MTLFSRLCRPAVSFSFFFNDAAYHPSRLNSFRRNIGQRTRCSLGTEAWRNFQPIRLVNRISETNKYRKTCLFDILRFTKSVLSVIRHVRPRTSSSPSFLCFVAAFQPLQNSPYSDPDISILRCNEGDDASCAPCRSSTKPRGTLLALIARWYFTNCVSLENIDSLIICVAIACSLSRIDDSNSRALGFSEGDRASEVTNPVIFTRS